MTTAEYIKLARNPFERLFDALVDPARRERTMALLLACYAAVWSLYGTIAKSGQDIHFDMGEMVAWSHEVILGTPKHPPLSAWLVRAWFSVMPYAPWAYYLFAVIVATAALWIAWRMSAPYLTPEKRVVGLVLLTFVPFYNFHALKFNANTVTMPFWAATTWWFLRAFETRRAGWAALAGAGAAASMLGKYWSVFLLAGLAVAALSDPRRSAYFRSPAPWITVAVGAVLLAPHLWWLATHNFAPFGYALNSHPATLVSAAESTVDFIVGVLGYSAAPIILVALTARPSLAAIGDTLWPAAPERRTLVITFAAPLLLAALAAVLAKINIVSLWTMSGVSLLPVVLLASPLITVGRTAGVRLLTLAVVFPLLMLAASPGVAIVLHREGVPNYASHYRLIARAVAHAWQAHTNAPLRIIGSYTNIVNGIVFYFANKPSTYDIMTPTQTPWVDDERIKREGVAIVCPMPVAHCITAMNGYAKRYAGTETEEVTLARRYFGTLDAPVRYRILIVPPQG
jgi:4-amino-4-deoxy-L-arabinose transferase-like glycosyltransferase